MKNFDKLISSRQIRHVNFSTVKVLQALKLLVDILADVLLLLVLAD